MNSEIIDFLNRHFPSETDCRWLNGNCYYMAAILQTRFPGGQIYYDRVDGHFLYYYRGHYYDWTGERFPEKTALANWDTYFYQDPDHWKRIWDDIVKQEVLWRENLLL